MIMINIIHKQIIMMSTITMKVESKHMTSEVAATNSIPLAAIFCCPRRQHAKFINKARLELQKCLPLTLYAPNNLFWTNKVCLQHQTHEKYCLNQFQTKWIHHWHCGHHKLCYVWRYVCNLIECCVYLIALPIAEFIIITFWSWLIVAKNHKEKKGQE